MRFSTTIRALMILLLAGVASCNKSQTENTRLEISTDMGDMEILLYDETPLHRDNFLRLVKEDYFDDLLFHRVIKDFMIQSGDSASRNAQQGDLLGDGDLGYLIPAEIRYPQYINKRGALAAAREGNEVNPEKKSSACQFYIVYGKTFTDYRLNEELRKRKERIIQKKVNELTAQSGEALAKYEQNNDFAGLQTVMDSLRSIAEADFDSQPQFTYNDSVRNIYKTIGGAPWLDGEYTVFGEVTKGLDVLEKIQAVKTDNNDRPLKDIRIRIKIR